MSTTVKRTTIALNKGDVFLLEELKNKYGEDTSQIYRRALTVLHYISFVTDTKQTNQPGEK
jgi:hypothetical protein